MHASVGISQVVTIEIRATLPLGGACHALYGCVAVTLIAGTLRWIECCGDSADSANTSVSREKQISACVQPHGHLPTFSNGNASAERSSRG